MDWVNVFAESFEPDEATILALRSDLARLLREYLKREGNQTAVAKRLGVTQSVVSSISNGNIQSLSLERMIKLCVRAGIPGTAQWAKSPHAARIVAGAWVNSTLTERSEIESPAIGQVADTRMYDPAYLKFLLNFWGSALNNSGTATGGLIAPQGRRRG
jgi:predicted XRE-type DNA-binding protein